MNFSFPSTLVEEGKVKVVVPQPSADAKREEYASSKAPVFYNPSMELNRDLAVVVLQAYQKGRGREIDVCEPLTACGIRGVRFAVEVEGVRKVLLNDINPEAAKLAQYNVVLNKRESLVSVAREGANLFLSRYAVPRKRVDYIDVDPFGSPVPYLGSALRALRNEGLLALTATDMAPLCGVHPKACIRKYGGKPLRTEYCHELAIRLLSGCLTMMAAKQEMGVTLLFSHSTDHYVRVYAVVRHGARLADKSIQLMGHILHCFSCLHREVSVGIYNSLKSTCDECGSRLSIGGPLWLGQIASTDFCSLMKRAAAARRFTHKKRVDKLISQVHAEAEAPATYYVVDKICDKLDLPIPPLRKIVEKLRRGGYQTAFTHFRSTGIKTDAPAYAIKEIIRNLVT